MVFRHLTRPIFWPSNSVKIIFGRDSAPEPTAGARDAPRTPYSVRKGDTPRLLSSVPSSSRVVAPNNWWILRPYFAHVRSVVCCKGKCKLTFHGSLVAVHIHRFKWKKAYRPSSVLAMGTIQDLYVPSGPLMIVDDDDVIKDGNAIINSVQRVYCAF